MLKIRYLLIALVIFLLAAVSLRFDFVSAEEPYLFDNFESYEVGTFPSSGGWKLIHSGWESTYQAIDNAAAVSGKQSLRLEGAADWPATIQRDYPLPEPKPNIIYYECSVKVTRMQKPVTWKHDFRIWAGETYGDSYCFGLVGFQPRKTDGKEYITFRSWDEFWGPEVELGKWYKIKVKLDLANDVGSLWLDDKPVFSDVPMGTKDNFYFAPAVTIEGGDDCRTRVWLDDVRFYSS